MAHGRDPVRVRQFHLTSGSAFAFARLLGRFRSVRSTTKATTAVVVHRTLLLQPAPALDCRLSGSILSRMAGRFRSSSFQPQPARPGHANPPASAPSGAIDPPRGPLDRIRQSGETPDWPPELDRRIPDQNPNNIGVDKAPDLRFPFLKIAIETRVLQRDRCLCRQQFQDRNSMQV